MCRRTVVALVTSAVLCLVVSAADAQDRWRVDFENGAAISGYNDVRIPGDTGTLFSFTEDLASDTAYFWRVRGDVRLAPKHVLSALVAPLTINSAGRFDRPVSFAGATFAPGVPVRGLYVFNSYRVTYRYEPIRRENWMFGHTWPLVWSFGSDAPGSTASHKARQSDILSKALNGGSSTTGRYVLMKA
jgi:hypothetical protein